MIDPHSIVVIGKTGQLARALHKLIPTAQFLGRPELDLANPHTFQNIPKVGVTHIINAAAYTNVDGAESTEGRREAWEVNAAGVHNLATYALANNCTLIHVSTDYVFDGTTPDHTETETPSPLNVYGQSKAAGEYAVGLLPKHYILRTQWLVGNGKNFVTTMLALGKQGANPTVVADQTGRLTFTSTLAQGILHLLDHNCPAGIYHISNSGPVASWAEVAQKVFALADLNNTVVPTSTESYLANKPLSARRPLHCEMNLQKLIQTGFQPKGWEEDLSDYLKEINNTSI